MKNICIFGDSTAWGAWDLDKGGWVNRLWLYCGQNDIDANIYNLSISGGTTETIIERFESEAKIREADIVIFQTGGNDSSYDKNTRKYQIDIKKFENNIEKIIARSKSVAKKIIFMGFKNCDEAKTVPVSWCDFCYTNEDIKKYNEVMKSVCGKYEIDFVDIFGLLENDDFDDGLHPNEKGHKKIFEKVKTFLIDNKII